MNLHQMSPQRLALANAMVHQLNARGDADHAIAAVDMARVARHH